MKKTSIVLLTILTIMMLTTSCLNDFLDVQPVSDTYSSKFWKTELEARTGLNSIYADFQNNFKGTGGMNYIGWYELRSDNCYGVPQGGTFLYSELNMNKLYPSHSSSNWNTWYKSISMTNIAIYYIQKMTNISEAKQNNLMAEAYFLRAYCYFNLVRIWGNVPIVVKPLLSFSDVTYPSKDSSKVVMDSIILKDLDMAVSKVDPSYYDRFVFNAGPLYSLCTDVAMWNHDYVNAEKYSALLFGLNRYTLVSGPDFYKTVSTAITTENIWTLQWSYINNGYNPVVQSLFTYTIVAKPVVDKWKTAEWRKDLRRPQTIDTTYSSIYGFTHLISTDYRAS
ncbi:MAG: RagB/SusD family nutrient uptake outer membrane protein, partial [Paludibacter sp.]